MNGGMVLKFSFFNRDDLWNMNLIRVSWKDLIMCKISK